MFYEITIFIFRRERQRGKATEFFGGEEGVKTKKALPSRSLPGGRALHQ